MSKKPKWQTYFPDTVDMWVTWNVSGKTWTTPTLENVHHFKTNILPWLDDLQSRWPVRYMAVYPPETPE